MFEGHEPEIARGGRTLYGIPLGVLMLDTHFPRIPGDVGNARTWPFPVLYKVVNRVGADVVVGADTTAVWLGPFVEAARELEAAGVRLITTSCGFLVLGQAQLQAELSVPVFSSSLLQVPWLAALLPRERRVGILTIDAGALTEAHLRAAGITDPARVAIQGLDEVDGGYFSRQILTDQPELDVARAAREHAAAARRLVERHPDVSAIVLECTNMPPYAPLIRAATGLPTFDLTTLVRWAVSATEGIA